MHTTNCRTGSRTEFFFMMTTRGHINVVPRTDPHLIAPTGTRGKTISIMRSGMNKRQVGKGILIFQCYLKSFSHLIAGNVKLQPAFMFLLQEDDNIIVVIRM